nr:endoglucanase 9-like [Coffea arabica]
MQGSKNSIGYSELDRIPTPVRFVHTVPGAGRLLPSSSRWNSIELDFNVLPQSSNAWDSIPPRYSRSISFNLTIGDKKHFCRFLVFAASITITFLILILLLSILPRRKHHHDPSKDLTLALNQALLFFDAQKSGHYPNDSAITFRGDSGLGDGNMATTQADLVGGFYDSGNNMKFSFPTAYTVTLLSWSVLEYHDKYADIKELDHVKDIIKWGSDYLLKLFIPKNTTNSAILYSQVGSPGNGPSGENSRENDISCWQRPEDMSYPRPVSVCDATALDLAGETVAGMSAAALVFKDQKDYSGKLVQAAEELFNLARNVDPSLKPGTYTSMDDCGGQAKNFYNSTSYRDEMVWGATWLFFATGNSSYLDYANDNFATAEEEELLSDKEVFSWNNKLAANAILLTRLRFFLDLGYPYETTFASTTNRTDLLMCSYTSTLKFPKTEGGLILLKPDTSGPLQHAATASFLTKLYGDYLSLLHRTRTSCGAAVFSLETLRDFSWSQVNYILGDNPMKISYMVGYGDQYPTQVHHRGASIPWDNNRHTCRDGEYWLNRKEANPNILHGAMVAGPDINDIFEDKRSKNWFTEPSISGNAGLVAALIALHAPPSGSSHPNGVNSGIDKTGLFDNIKVVPSTS